MFQCLLGILFGCILSFASLAAGKSSSQRNEYTVSGPDPYTIGHTYHRYKKKAKVTTWNFYHHHYLQVYQPQGITFTSTFLPLANKISPAQKNSKHNLFTRLTLWEQSGNTFRFKGNDRARHFRLVKKNRVCKGQSKPTRVFWHAYSNFWHIDLNDGRKRIYGQMKNPFHRNTKRRHCFRDYHLIREILPSGNIRTFQHYKNDMIFAIKTFNRDLSHMHHWISFKQKSDSKRHPRLFIKTSDSQRFTVSYTKQKNGLHNVHRIKRPGFSSVYFSKSYKSSHKAKKVVQVPEKESLTSLRKQHRKKGKRALYKYAKGTNLVKAKFSYSRSKIRAREFFSYDKNAIVTKHIVDDGSSRKKNSLKGVTKRRTTKITSRKKRPFFGMPLVIKEYSFDPKKKKNVFLKKTVHDYTKDGRLKKTSTHNAHKQRDQQVTSTKNRHKRKISLTHEPMDKPINPSSIPVFRCIPDNAEEHVKQDTTHISIPETTYTASSTSLPPTKSSDAHNNKKKLAALSINPDELEKIYREKETHPIPAVQRRLHAIYLIACGKKQSEVARLVGCAPVSVKNWITIYNKDGIEGLKK